MGLRRYVQVDVFTDVPLQGNPLAVVLDAEGLDDLQMQRFARWTNLSETAFVLPSAGASADYRVRIFKPERELPFAGHPTLGSCHAWLAAGGVPHGRDVVQHCGIGLVRVRRDGHRLAFAAPPLRRSGAVDAGTTAQVLRALRLAPSEVGPVQWVDNGPGWLAVWLPSASAVLAVQPDMAAMGAWNVGVVGPHPPGHPSAFEVRAFAPGIGVPEDPVTGSLNAGLAHWLIGAGLAPHRYVASQGQCLGRAGQVHVALEHDTVWVGGHSVTCIDGRLSL